MNRVINSLKYRISQFFKSFKGYLDYLKLKHSHQKLNHTLSKKYVVFYFNDRALIKYAFPYYFALIDGFIKNGFDVYLDFKRSDQKMITELNRQLFQTKNLHLLDTREKIKNSKLIICDKFNKDFPKGIRTICLNPNIQEFTNDPSQILMPFFKHPKQLSKECKDLTEQRSVKVFFSGNAHRNSYQRDIFGLMSRSKILDAAIEEYKQSDWRPSEGDQAFKGDVVIQDWQWSFTDGGNISSRISDDEWLQVLSRVDFFLSPPGIQIPFSHNIIEAMCAGAIPITNYGHLFQPKLDDGVHCLSFEDKTSLLQAIKKALAMGDAEKSLMRRNIKVYYSTYLKTESFVQFLLDNDKCKTVYFYGTGLTEDPTSIIS